MPQGPMNANIATKPSGVFTPLKTDDSGNLLIANPSLNGSLLFVDSANGDNDNSGTSWSKAFATIAAAVAAAAPGDVLYLATGTYAETVTVATDYLTIIGAAPSGYGKPDWAVASGIPLIVSGQGFVASNIRFASDDADVVVQHGNGFAYTGCVFDGSGQASDEALLRLVGATNDSHSASEGVILNNLFRGNTLGIGIAMQYALAAAGGEGTTDNQIIGNRFVANGVDLKSLTNTNGGGAGIFLRYTIAQNQFMTVGASYVYADMNQGAAGDLAANSALISGNWFADAALIASQFAINGQPKTIFTGNYDAAGLVNGAAFNS